MATLATFTGPHGQDPVSAVHATVDTLGTITSGDLLYVGQVFRSRIRQRTFNGVDVHGAAFAPYSTKGPYYFYPNGGLGDAKARATAAKNRHRKTGGAGVRTPFGIRYDSYAAAKAAHGVSGVNLYGMEQHPHMLDALVVRVGAREADQSTEGLDFGSELSAFEQSEPAHDLDLGFYGEEAARAEGNNEGTGRGGVKREFFALNGEDLQLAETAIGERIEQRARATA